MNTSRSVSTAVAYQHTRQRLALAYGHRIPLEGRMLVDLSGATRQLGQAKLSQQARENITQQGEAAEDREFGVFVRHSPLAPWEGD